MRGSGRVFKRARSPFYWMAYVHNGKEIRESTEIPHTEENPKKAAANEKKAHQKLEDRLEEIKAEKRFGIPFVGPQQQRVRVNSLLDALEQDYKAREKSTPQFLSHLGRMRESFGSWRGIEVTAEAIDEYINKSREGGFSDATINRGTQLLAQAFKLAVERKRLSPSLVPSIRHLPERNARQGFFADADFAALVEALPEYLRDFARFGYVTGWRKGEIASLLWSDVDGDVIRLRPEHSKNGQARSVPLCDSTGKLTEVGEIVERRRRGRKIETDQGPAFASHVFHSKGRPIGDIRKAWATASKSVGLDGKLFHDLRRTAVRNMIRAGVPERVAMEISGHKTRSIFDRYNIVNERDKQEALVRTKAYVNASTKKRRVAVMAKRAPR